MLITCTLINECNYQRLLNCSGCTSKERTWTSKQTGGQILAMSWSRTDCDDGIPSAPNIHSFCGESRQARFDKAFTTRYKQLATFKPGKARKEFPKTDRQAVLSRLAKETSCCRHFFFFFFQKHMQCNVTALFPSLPKSACVLCVRPHFHECTVVMRTCLHHQIPSVQPLYSKLWQDYSYQSVADLGSVPTLSIQLLNVCDVNCHCVGLEAILTQLGWW